MCELFMLSDLYIALIPLADFTDPDFGVSHTR